MNTRLVFSTPSWHVPFRLDVCVSPHILLHHALMITSQKNPSDDVLESLFKLRMHESDQLKTVLELYVFEIHPKISTSNHQKIKTMVQRRKGQKLRLCNGCGLVMKLGYVQQDNGMCAVWLYFDTKRSPYEHMMDEVHCASAAILAQAIWCSNVHGVFPVHERFWFCLVQVATTQFCSFPPVLMARATDGTDVPVSPLLVSSSNVGSPHGSLPDLEGTGYRASTMEENQRNVRTSCEVAATHTERIQVRKLRPNAFPDSGLVWCENQEYSTNGQQPCCPCYHIGNKCNVRFQWIWLGKIMEHTCT